VRPRTLMIVGATSPVEGNRRFPPHYDEMWTFLSAAKKDKTLREKATLIWDCHGQPDTNSLIKRSKYRGVELPLFDLRMPLQCGSHRERRFNPHELTLEYGYRFSSQITWMLGWAIECQFKHIILWRLMDSQQSHDYMHQACDIYYFIGRGEAEGITFEVDPNSALLIPGVYGAEQFINLRRRG